MKCNCKIKKHCNCNKLSIEETRAKLKTKLDPKEREKLQNRIDYFDYGYKKNNK